MNSNLIQCPFCQAGMQLPPNVNTSEVICPTCHNRVAIGQPAAYPTAQKPPVGMPSANPSMTSGAGQQGQPGMHPQTAPSQSAPMHTTPMYPATNNTNRGIGILIALVLVGTLLLLLLIGIGIGLYFMLGDQPDPQPLARENRIPESLDGNPGNQAGNGPSERAVPRNQINPAPTGDASSALSLDLKVGEKYSYYYTLDAKINERKVSYSGINGITPSRSFRQDATIGQRVMTLNHSTTMTSFASRGGQIDIPMPGDTTYDRGILKVDRTGDYFSEEQQDMVPILMKPLGMVGIERLSSGARNWSDDQEIVLTEVEQQEVDPFDPLARYRDRFSRSPYRRSTNPYGRSEPKVTTSIVKRIETYRIESETGSRIRVAKSLEIAPKHSSDKKKFSTRVSAKGHFVFDKKLNLVTESHLKGTASITEGAISLTVPFEFKVRYQSKDELLAAANRRKKAAEARQQAARKAPPTRDASKKSIGTSPVKSNARDVSDLLIGTVDKVTWGAKGMAVAQRGNKTFLAVVKMDQHLQVYDWEKQMMTDDSGRLNDAGHGTCAAATPDGSKILYGGYSGPIPVYELDENGKLSKAGQFEGHSKEIKFMCVADDNDRVISGGREKKLRVWSLKDYKERAVIAGFDRDLVAGCLNADQKTALVSDGQFVYTVDLENEKIKLKTKVQYGTDVCFSRDGKLFAERQGVKVMIIRDTSNMKEIARFESNSFPRHLSFSPDNQQLYWGTHGWAHVYHMKSKKEESFKVHKTFGLEGIAFSPDGSQCAIATGASGGQIIFLKRVADQSAESKPRTE